MRAALSALPVWAWSIMVLQALWSLISLLAVRQVQKETAAEKDACREDRWQLNNAKERLERLRLKGILTPETRLPLSERRAEPMPRPVTAPTTPEEAARNLAALWDVLGLVEDGARIEFIRARLRTTLGQEDRP